MLPDRTGQKSVENAKIAKLQIRHFDYFSSNIHKSKVIIQIFLEIRVDDFATNNFRFLFEKLMKEELEEALKL